MMIIEKTASQKNNFHNGLTYFESARKAFEYVLKTLTCEDDYELLLPDYIGFSTREGSGIYDPVLASGIKHIFYRLNKNLQIDKEDFLKKIETNGRKIVLLVHYFGIPDIDLNKIVNICKEHNAIVIEDAAHALFSDYIDHVCGNIGDFVLYSIHKMLPYEEGGILKTNSERYLKNGANPIRGNMVFEYNFFEIAKRRKSNAKIWDRLFSNPSICTKYIVPFYPFRADVTYQTFPIIVRDGFRDKFYFELNNQGFGAVSLYHELIEPLKNDLHKDTRWVSENILNLPVHQDVNEKEIEQMFECMEEIIRRK